MPNCQGGECGGRQASVEMYEPMGSLLIRTTTGLVGRGNVATILCLHNRKPGIRRKYVRGV